MLLIAQSSRAHPTSPFTRSETQCELLNNSLELQNEKASPQRNRTGLTLGGQPQHLATLALRRKRGTVPQALKAGDLPAR